MKLTKLEQTVWDLSQQSQRFEFIASQLNHRLSVVEAAFARAAKKRVAAPVEPQKPALPPGTVTDGQILEAVAILSSHHRGLKSLARLRQLFLNHGAEGFDSVNMAALQTLVKAVAVGRRDFLYTLPRE